MRRTLTVFAFACIVTGFVLRLGISLHAAVSYDEVFVTGIGLDEMGVSARAFFIDVPLRRSNGGTPLWWWVQAVHTLLAGRITLWGLRLAPVLLGGATLVITFLVARATLGRGPATLFVMFAALSDVLAFCNARGEFAESLLLCWVMPGACLIGRRKHTLTKGILGWLILMTHLGKGLFLVGAMALSDAVAQAVHFRSGRAVIRPGISLGIAVIPALCWLMIAGSTTVAGTLMTDIGPVTGPGDMLWKLTARYAETKPHMVATPFDAIQIWIDGGVWPIAAVTAVPVLVGVFAAVGRFRGRRGSLCLGLTLWIGLGLMAVVGRGLIGARFHLLYLPAVWLAASVGLWRLRRLGHPGCLALGGLWIVSVWVAFSWASWEDRTWGFSTLAVIFAGLSAAAVGLVGWRRFGTGRRSTVVRATAWCVCAGMVAALLLTCGPMRWAPFARMEPFAGREELAAIDAHRRGKAHLPGRCDRTLYIDLANYFLRKENRTAQDLRRAEHYTRLETERDPHDARAWFYLGETLRQLGAPVERVRPLWERSYQLHPTPMLEQHLQELPQTTP